MDNKDVVINAKKYLRGLDITGSKGFAYKTIESLLTHIEKQGKVVEDAQCLLDLKKHKIMNGKDDFYLQHKEVAWYDLEYSLNELNDRGGKE